MQPHPEEAVPNSQDVFTVIFHGTSNGHKPDAPLPETVLDAMYEGMKAKQNVVIFDGVGKDKRPGKLFRAYEDRGLPPEVANAEVKLEDQHFLLGKARGLLLGAGMQETAFLAVQEIFRYKHLHGKFPTTINILGRSRGGITGILFAHQIREIFGESIQVNIITLDPVAGTSNRSHHEIRSLPEHVTYKTILAGDEAKPGFEVQGPDRMIVPTSSTAEFVHLPGTHETASKQRENQHAGVANLAHDMIYKFLTQHGSDFAKVPQIVWRSKGNPKRHEQREYKAYNEQELLATYHDLACNTSKYKSWWGLARSRSHIDHLSSFNGHLHFFVNDEHRQLFRAQHPELYDYFFTGKSRKTTAEDTLLKLEALRVTDPILINWLVNKGLINAVDDKPIQLNDKAIAKIRPYWGDALDLIVTPDEPQDSKALEQQLKQTLDGKISIAIQSLSTFTRLNTARGELSAEKKTLVELVRDYSLKILELKHKEIKVDNPSDDPAILASQKLLAMEERIMQLNAKIHELVEALQKSPRIPYALYFGLGDALTYTATTEHEQFKEKILAVRTAYFNALSRNDANLTLANLLWVNCMRIAADPRSTIAQKSEKLNATLNGAIKRLDPNKADDRPLFDDLLHARTLKDTVLARVLKDIKSYQKWNLCKSYLALVLKVITFTLASPYNRSLAQQKYDIAHKLGSELKELQKRAATMTPERYQMERDSLILGALEKARQARIEHGMTKSGGFEERMSLNLSDGAKIVYTANLQRADVSFVEKYNALFFRPAEGPVVEAPAAPQRPEEPPLDGPQSPPAA